MTMTTVTPTARRATLNAMVWIIWTAVRERPPRTVSLMRLSNYIPRAVESGQKRHRPLDVKFPVATWINRFIPVKAAADEACLEPSFLNIGPGGNSRAQRNLDHGSKTLEPTQSNEPGAIAISSVPGPLSSGSVVKPIPEVLERSSLTPASMDADQSSTSTSVQIRVLLGTCVRFRTGILCRWRAHPARFGSRREWPVGMRPGRLP